jgi:hypothetical protein
LVQASHDCNVKYVQIVNCMIKHFQIDQKILDTLTLAWIKGLNKHKNIPTELNNKVKIISNYMTHAIERKLFDPKKKLENWMHFCQEYGGEHKCIEQLLKVLQKTDQSSNIISE